MAKRAFEATFQCVAAGTSAATSITSAPTSNVGDFTVDCSPTVIECAYRGCNQKTVLTGLKTCTIAGSLAADASALAILRAGFRAATDVYAKITFADGSSIAGQFAVTKVSIDEPVDGEERWDFEIQPSANATPDSSGDVVTYTAASTSST